MRKHEESGEKHRKNMGKEGELRENIEKHEKTRDNVGKTGECMATQGKFSPGFEPSHLCDPSKQMRPQGALFGGMAD